MRRGSPMWQPYPDKGQPYMAAPTIHFSYHSKINLYSPDTAAPDF